MGENNNIHSSNNPPHDQWNSRSTLIIQGQVTQQASGRSYQSSGEWTSSVVDRVCRPISSSSNFLRNTRWKIFSIKSLATFGSALYADSTDKKIAKEMLWFNCFITE